MRLIAAALLATTTVAVAGSGTADLVAADAGLAERGEAATRCAYDPASGRPNPLGMRTFVSVHREGTDSVFVYESLPALVGDGSERATLAVRRTLLVPASTLAEARAWLRARDAVFDELVGHAAADGYGPIDDALTCR